MNRKRVVVLLGLGVLCGALVLVAASGCYLYPPLLEGGCSAHSLIVRGDKVLVVGDWHDLEFQAINQNGGEPCYWENGIRMAVDFDPPSGGSRANYQMYEALADDTGLYLWGSSNYDYVMFDDVYSADSVVNYWWKDGVLHQLDDSNQGIKQPFLHNGELIWIAWPLEAMTGPAFLQDKQLVLPQDNGCVTGTLSEGNSLYVCGMDEKLWGEGDPASFVWWWVDGTRHVVDTSAFRNAVVSGLVKSGGDVWLAGAVLKDWPPAVMVRSPLYPDGNYYTTWGQACLWKNGIELIELGAVDCFNRHMLKPLLVGNTIQVIYAGMGTDFTGSSEPRYGHYAKRFVYDLGTGEISEEIFFEGSQTVLIDCASDGNSVWFLTRNRQAGLVDVMSYDVYREHELLYRIAP